MKKVKCRCPACHNCNITIIKDLKLLHCGGDKWCLDCGKIFDAEDLDDLICNSLQKGNMLK